MPFTDPAPDKLETDSTVSPAFAPPFTLPSGATLPNRMVKAAMEENMAVAGQLPPGKELVELYHRWSRGGGGNDHHRQRHGSRGGADRAGRRRSRRTIPNRAVPRMGECRKGRRCESVDADQSPPVGRFKPTCPVSHGLRPPLASNSARTASDLRIPRP